MSKPRVQTDSFAVPELGSDQSRFLRSDRVKGGEQQQTEHLK